MSREDRHSGHGPQGRRRRCQAESHKGGTSWRQGATLGLGPERQTRLLLCLGRLLTHGADVCRGGTEHRSANGPAKETYPQTTAPGAGESLLHRMFPATTYLLVTNQKMPKMSNRDKLVRCTMVLFATLKTTL